MNEKEFDFFSKAYMILVKGVCKEYGCEAIGAKVVLAGNQEEPGEEKAS